jgi:hypothetical protein
VFGRLYGSGIPTLARQVGCSEPVAEAMVATLDEMTPTLAAWSARLRNRVKAGNPVPDGRTPVRSCTSPAPTRTKHPTISESVHRQHHLPHRSCIRRHYCRTEPLKIDCLPLLQVSRPSTISAETRPSTTLIEPKGQNGT